MRRREVESYLILVAILMSISFFGAVMTHKLRKAWAPTYSQTR
jgi:hypothetical protein